MMPFDSDCITVTAPVSYKKFNVPNFASMQMPPRPRQEGMQEAPSVPLSEIPNAAFVRLVEAWVDDMYRKHKQIRPPEAAPGCPHCDA